MALILCGSGNNGGDGIAAGKYLLEDGFQARLLMIGNREKLTQDSRKMCALLEQQGGMLEDGTPETVKGMLPHADLVIDALFGTGFPGMSRALYADIIAAVNASECPVLACDIASGISADTGRSWAAPFGRMPQSPSICPKPDSCCHRERNIPVR